MIQSFLRTLLAGTLLTGTVVTVQGCNSRSDIVQLNTPSERTDDLADNKTSSARFRAERDQTIASLRQQCAELDLEIDELSGEIERRRGFQIAVLEEGLAELKRERQELLENIAIVEEATAETWQDIKIGFGHEDYSLGRASDNTDVAIPEPNSPVANN
ncbi:hypothetical protein BN8_05238 [Fibrisoma limi BUZ 3]|uniref:Uncharacterized protein n=1 Tax=Fibrisoma limi BUZ 3 TaxID=1185876 RepID=I2GPW0_9BACT|nr:hypothetical protein [Fibrisoma limi]CCH55938.1 hypothetical protein BN8_05238 [Fibrisoma limi BUZ 3]